MNDSANKLIVFFALLFAASCSDSARYENKIYKILEYKADGCYFEYEQFEKVFAIIENNPRTFEIDFSDPYYSSSNPFAGFKKSRSENMLFVESDDKQVRAYVLEMYGFSGIPSLGIETHTLLQYRIGDDIYTYRMLDTHSYIEEIARLSNNRYLIIAYYGSIAQGEHHNNQARVYSIDESGVHMLSGTFEKDGNLSDEMELYWDEGLIRDYELEECGTEHETYGYLESGIYYDWLDGYLYVADTDEDDFYTGTYRRYRWNGAIFKLTE